MHDDVGSKPAAVAISNYPGEELAFNTIYTDKKYKIVVAIDHFSKKARGHVYKNKSAQNVKSFLNQLMNLNLKGHFPIMVECFLTSRYSIGLKSGI